MPTTSVSILDDIDKVATFAGGLFAGTALYMTIGEVPALKEYGVDRQWEFFPLMYSRAAVSQSVFTMVAGISGITHAIRQTQTSDRNLWLVAGSLFVGMVPYTLIFMIPTNKAIINDNKNVNDGQSSKYSPTQRAALLEKWNLLHLGRTLGSVVAFGLMTYGLSRR